MAHCECKPDFLIVNQGARVIIERDKAEQMRSSMHITRKTFLGIRALLIDFPPEWTFDDFKANNFALKFTSATPAHRKNLLS
jgi:hypothetical protein